MRQATLHPRLGRHDLEALAEGTREGELDDMEFFETLAQKHCLVMPPWIYHIDHAGHLEKVTAVRYTPEYHLDKPRILLAVMDRLPHLHG
jgi:hypothetical protein